VPLGKTLVLSLAISILSSLFIFPGLVYGINDSDHFLPLSNGDTQASEAFTSITESFAQMNVYLAAQEFKDGYYFISAETAGETQENLQKAGFSSSLSARIVSAYLLWKPDYKRLVLIPTDSIPILTPRDREQTEYLLLDKNTVIFRLELFDCYRTGDQYSLFVTGMRDKGRWFIYEWHFCES